LSAADRRTIVFQYYDCGKSFKEIADLIPSPRLRASIHVDTVRRVVKYFQEHGRVVVPRETLMPDEHAVVMIEIIEENPWLYLDELSAELLFRIGVSYKSKKIYNDLVVRGFSLKV
jgi:transposase